MSSTAVSECLREVAADLLSQEKASVIIGYGRDDGDPVARPIFVQQPEDADRLIFGAACLPNLAVYLPKPAIRALGKTAVVLKGCDLRAVNVLLREHVVDRDDVVLIGVRCRGVGEPLASKCAACDDHEPQGCDVVVGEPVEADTDGADRYVQAAAVEEMPLDERWAFWRAHLQRCIRCYACRSACPLCYCKRCIVEKTQPQWVETSPHLRGNVAWNVARALHLTGRCVGCGECARVCPMGIPLGALNQKMAKLVDDWYGFRSGQSPDETAPFSTFDLEDPEEGIL